MRDARQLRIRQADIRGSIDRSRTDEGDHCDAQVVELVKIGITWPSGPGYYWARNTVLAGPDIVGTVLTATPVGQPFLALNIGYGSPPDPTNPTPETGMKTIVLCTLVGGVLIFDYADY